MMGSKARGFDPIDGLTLADLVPTDHCSRHLDARLIGRSCGNWSLNLSLDGSTFASRRFFGP